MKLISHCAFDSCYLRTLAATQSFKFTINGIEKKVFKNRENLCIY